MSNQTAINEVLAPYGVAIDNVTEGARVTRYSATLTPSVPVNKLLKLRSAFTIALNDNSVDIRQDGNQLIIEVADGNGIVRFSDFVRESDFVYDCTLPIAIGQSVDGDYIYTDLAKQPHMLVAGETGGGKSIFLHSLIASLLKKSQYVDLFAIDMKGTEFSVYQDIKYFHYIKDIPNAIHTLASLCKEMDRRYEVFTQNGWRDIEAAAADGRYFSRVVCIIDEFSDLMLKSGASSQVEEYVVRLAQKSRAAGIHLVIATQHPSAKVITGLIKANIPCKVGFKTTTALYSRIIMDRNGCEKLLGNGDMLFLGNGKTEVIRAQSCYLSDDEMKQIANETVEYIARIESQQAEQQQKQATRPESRNRDTRNRKEAKQKMGIRDTVKWMLGLI